MEDADKGPNAINTSKRVILGKFGEADCGRGVGQALEVINILADYGIPSCVVGVKALVYYGAHRVPEEWDICVPTASFDQAKAVFTSSPLNEKYDVWHPVTLQLKSLAHTYPRFTLKGFNFFFFLMPAFEWCIDDVGPDHCERSESGIPYLQLKDFAQSLLDCQQDPDLDDLVDGMDLDETWGEENLQLDKPVPVEWIRQKNEMILQSLPASYKSSGVLALLSERPRPPREVWLRSVRTKHRRFGHKWSRDGYLTRYRRVGSKDPRENKKREV